MSVGQGDVLLLERVKEAASMVLCLPRSTLVTLHVYHTEGGPLRLHFPLSFDDFLSVPFVFLVFVALLDCP